MAGRRLGPTSAANTSRKRFILGAALVLTLALDTVGWGKAPAETAASAETQRDRARDALTDLEGWVSKQGGRLTAHVRDLQTGETRLSSAPDAVLNPASNMKVVTAAAALDLLGPNHTFQTGIYGKIRDGQSRQLVLRGHGDPSLEESDLWRLANALVNLGLSSVEELLVDQSYFDEQFVPPAFEQQPDEWAAFRAPISATALARNAIALNVLAREPGTPARVWIEPSGVVAVDGTIATKPSGRGQDVRLELKPTPQGLTAVIGGHVSTGLPRQRHARRLDDPRLAPGLNLAHHLRSRGVNVARVGLGGSDIETRITYAASTSLSELVRELGKNSDNFYAEMLFKVLAAEGGVHPRTSPAAAKAVQAWLEKQGPLPEGSRIVNGSGLFDANRLSASTLTRVLAKAYADPRTRNEFVSHLAIGGVDGTLRSRFTKHSSARLVRAKTGTLRNVVSLSGYLMRETGHPLAFSVIVNGIDNQHVATRRRVDALIEQLAAPADQGPGTN
jgi:D-alanyl-D-alanine carboxypeptidase/D-alanyl-D-alanine-endopeptidase (penicillin-binding protein 4)